MQDLPVPDIAFCLISYLLHPCSSHLIPCHVGSLFPWGEVGQYSLKTTSRRKELQIIWFSYVLSLVSDISVPLSHILILHLMFVVRCSPPVAFGFIVCWVIKKKILLLFAFPFAIAQYLIVCLKFESVIFLRKSHVNKSLNCVTTYLKSWKLCRFSSVRIV